MYPTLSFTQCNNKTAENSNCKTVLKIDQENKDVLVKFLHPPLPSRSLHWSERDDNCYVPNTNILCIIQPPVTCTGRQYCLIESDLNDVNIKWQNFTK